MRELQIRENERKSRYGVGDRGVRLYGALPVRPNPEEKRLPSSGFDGDNMYMSENNQEFLSPSQGRERLRLAPNEPSVCSGSRRIATVTAANKRVWSPPRVDLQPTPAIDSSPTRDERERETDRRKLNGAENERDRQIQPENRLQRENINAASVSVALRRFPSLPHHKFQCKEY
ncbi:hypothetical protein QQF64_028124 [Cirrhinus molitorella]|uniref:Uncharacterized protein n=1 Tax=Cirrhinus molitorella TaxID=172907 RepID=A0ABR3N633_9TELE